MASIRAVPKHIERKADEYCHNLEGLEASWAKRAFHYAEKHEEFLRGVPVNASIDLSGGHDQQIYVKFKAHFAGPGAGGVLGVWGTVPGFITEDVIKSLESKNLWRPFCMQFENVIEDYNMGTLLRLDPTKGYSQENTTIAPRIQFLAVEIARNVEGINDSIRTPRKEGADGQVYRLYICCVCGEPAPFRCARCKLARYCSRECQTRDWKKHKASCGEV
ncbi:protein PBDC1 [Pelomyxa schiedti]|nr:protein PBDC1 [Pelomyxa schiedti]